VEQSGCQTAQRCAVVRRSGPRLIPGWGALEQSIDAKPFRGQRVCLRVETHDPEGSARLIMETETGEFDEIDIGSVRGQKIRSP
jgi:hypothetical protein